MKVFTTPILFQLVIVFAFLFLSSCSSRPSENPSAIDTWQISSEESPVKKLSELIEENYFLVPLQTNDSSLIVKVEKLVLDQDQLFVLDPLSPQPIKVFDSKGNHLRNIGLKGGGPGEFQNPIDMLIDEEFIYVYDNPENLLQFDRQGNFISSKKTGVAGFRIEKNKDNGFVFINGGTEFNLVTTDASFGAVKSHFPYQNRFVDQLILSPLIKSSDGSVIFRRYLNDTIFKIADNGNPTPYLFIDHRDKAFKMDATINPDQLEDAIADYSVNQLFLENSTHQLVYFQSSMTPYFSIRNKSKQDSFLINFMNLENDITFTNPLAFTFSTSNWFVSSIDPAFLPTDLSSLPEKAKATILNVSKGDNPILLFCKFR